MTERPTEPPDPARGARVEQLIADAIGAGRRFATRDELAAALDVSPRSFYNWFRGGTIKPENLRSLVEVLDTTPDYILHGTSPPTAGDVSPGEAVELVERLSRQQEIARRILAHQPLTGRQLAELERLLAQLAPDPPRGAEHRPQAGEGRAA